MQREEPFLLNNTDINKILPWEDPPLSARLRKFPPILDDLLAILVTFINCEFQIIRVN